MEATASAEAWLPLLKDILVVLWSLGLISWFSAVICLICIPFNTLAGSLPNSFRLRVWFRPDGFRDWMLLNPLNVILYSHLLTPKGLVLRKWLFILIGVFIGCVALGILLATLAARP